MKKFNLGLLCMFLLWNAHANENAPPKTGNFALPSSQQPGPLLSLGQNILDAKVAQLYLAANDFSGTNQHFVNVTPSALYGITDTFSVFFDVPFAASYQQENTRSSGLEDIFLQFEYGYNVNDTSQFSELGTILANITFPTGSTEKQPNTGIGAVSFLLATTYSRTYCDWYGFISSGAVITTSHNKTKFGNSYIYQLGIGRNLAYNPSKWIISGLVEIDGQYSERDTIHNERDNNSGGNVIYITPSLNFSNNRFILQLGAGFPPVQHLFGEQNKNHYLLVASLGWTL